MAKKLNCIRFQFRLLNESLPALFEIQSELTKCCSLFLMEFRAGGQHFIY